MAIVDVNNSTIKKSSNNYI